MPTLEEYFIYLQPCFGYFIHVFQITKHTFLWFHAEAALVSGSPVRIEYIAIFDLNTSAFATVKPNKCTLVHVTHL